MYATARGRAGTGVFGYTDAGRGVVGIALNGRHTSPGTGVEGWTDRGVAGQFIAGPGGTGLDVVGKVHFSQAATRFAPGGQDFYDIVGIVVRDASFALVTLQGAPQELSVVSVEKVHGTAGRGFRVHFSDAIPESGVTLGFMVLESL